ncbi:MAG: hypothetical protein KTR23_07900 [Rhodospirillales bacterium]|nr:hypothetical protein [Rhodospirillales bacterium]
MENAIDLVSLIASIASLVLAVLAIWLSIFFYKMSDQAAKKTDDAAKDISSSVQKLEKIFDKLYSDTFSMMRDTVADMRTHIWKQSDVENDEIADFKKEIKDQIKKDISNIEFKDAPVYGELLSKIQNVVDNAFVRDPVREFSDLESRILDCVIGSKHITLANLALLLKVPIKDIVQEIFDLRIKGYLYWDGIETELGNDDVILPGNALLEKPKSFPDPE